MYVRLYVRVFMRLCMHVHLCVRVCACSLTNVTTRWSALKMSYECLIAPCQTFQSGFEDATGFGFYQSATGRIPSVIRCGPTDLCYVCMCMRVLVCACLRVHVN